MPPKSSMRLLAEGEENDWDSPKAAEFAEFLREGAQRSIDEEIIRLIEIYGVDVLMRMLGIQEKPK
jgi:hypothetical protein